MAFFVDRLHDRVVIAVVLYILNKDAVDLQIIYRKIAQIGVGREPGAKIIK